MERMGEFGWAIGVGIIILAVSVGKTLQALGRMLASRSARPDGGGDAAAAELRTELNDMRQRLTELEERLDFTERLLAKQREADRLPRPQD